MKVLLKIIFKEAFRLKKFSLLFIFNLTLALFGLVFLESFQHAFQVNVQQKALTLLGSDVQISARRPLSKQEFNSINQIVAYDALTEMTEFYSMGRSNQGQSRLVLVKAIDPLNYPYYGHLVPSKTSSKLKEQKIWIYPELLPLLKTKIGEKIRLGDQEFTIDATIKDDSTQSMRGFSLAYVVYMNREDLVKTNLIQKGSTVWYSSNFKLKRPLSNSEKAQLEKKLDDPQIRIKTPKNVNEGLGRVLNYLGDYLGLISIVALFLGQLALTFLFRFYLKERFTDIAIYQFLGLEKKDVFRIILGHLVLFSFFASFLILLIAWPSLSYLFSYLNRTLALDLQFIFPIKSFILCLILGLFIGPLSCLPLLRKIYLIEPKGLFQNFSFDQLEYTWKDIFWSVPFWVLLGILSLWQANSIKVGGLFFVSFLSLYVALQILVKYFLGLLNKRQFHWKNIKTRFLVRSFYFNRQGWTATFLAMTFGLLLLCLIANIYQGISQELVIGSSTDLPNFFMFDIQENQLKDIKKFVKINGGELKSLSPLVRSRLVKVNGKDFQKKSNENKYFVTRESEVRNRFRNRGLNLSFRDGLSASEKIIKGKPIEAMTNSSLDSIGISLEMRFAQRLGLDIGDELTFDVYGQKIRGKVQNLRRVRWTSFEPNFFIQFPLGVLDDAPKTYLASLYLYKNSKLGSGKFQTLLADKFPNISVVDISLLSKKLRQIVDKLYLTMQVMSGLTIFIGLFVLFSVSFFQFVQKIPDINFFKILGMPWKDIFKLNLSEGILTAIVSCLLGEVLAIGLSSLMAYYLFDQLWMVNFKLYILLFCFYTMIAFLVSFFIGYKVVKKPAAFSLKKSSHFL